jgi:DNA (cytosine-5)-methyltransferase 3A
MLPEIDLMIGGSPCQDLSIAKKDRKGLDGDRSGLFWEYVRILKEVKPKYFILENVASMPKADRDIITEEMGVEPVMFNASLVSAQSRKRLFWTNIKFELPQDRGIVLKDIIQPDVDKCFFLNKEMNVREKKQLKEQTDKSICLLSSMYKGSQSNGMTLIKVGYIGEGEQYGQGGQAHRVYSPDGKTPTLSSYAPLIKLGHVGNSDAQGNRVYSPDGKSPTLSANGGGLGAKTGLIICRDVGRRLKEDGTRSDNDMSIPITRRIELRDDDKCGTLTSVSKDNQVFDTETTKIRKLTPIECERLQGLPDDYTAGVSNTQRYKCLGNAFNVDVVATILGGVL